MSKAESCELCPRRCRAIRPESVPPGKGAGVCKMGRLPVVARAGLHLWEEPCVSGAIGSGTVFFSGCSLGCTFCQNYKISAEGFGREISVSRLREIYGELIRLGAHNINLVSPTHFTDAVLDSLDPPLPVPVVWNSGGYERVETLRRLEGKVQVYLPDMKYSDDALSLRYSGARNYFEAAKAAIAEMVRQTGPYEMRGGLLAKGVLIRHLILPGQMENTRGVIDWIASAFPPKTVLMSLMGQYTPCGPAACLPPLNRRITRAEYRAMEEYLLASGITDGYLQEPEASGNFCIPAFDLTGV